MNKRYRLSEAHRRADLPRVGRRPVRERVACHTVPIGTRSVLRSGEWPVAGNKLDGAEDDAAAPRECEVDGLALQLVAPRAADLERFVPIEKQTDPRLLNL